MDNNKLLDKLKNWDNCPTNRAWGEVSDLLCPELVSHNGKDFALLLSDDGRKVSIWWDEDNKRYQVVVGDFPKTWDEQYPPDIDFDVFWDGFQSPLPLKKPKIKRKAYKTLKRAVRFAYEEIVVYG